MDLTREEKFNILKRIFDLPDKQRNLICQSGHEVPLGILDMSKTEIIAILKDPPKVLSPATQMGKLLKYYQIKTTKKCPDCNRDLMWVILAPEAE